MPDSKKGENGGFAETGANIMLWYAEGGELFTPFLRKYAGVNDQGQALYWVDEDLLDANGAAITSRCRSSMVASQLLFRFMALMLLLRLSIRLAVRSMITTISR